MRRDEYLHPEIAKLVEQRLDPAEFERRVSAPLGDEELAANLELIQWFERRYPTVKDRLDYARHMFVQMTRPLRAVPRDDQPT